jgi:hypothetical protein
MKISRTSFRLLRRLHRVTPINLLQYPFCPADSVSDGAHRGRNPRSAVVLRQLPCREDAGGDQQHAPPAMIPNRGGIHGKFGWGCTGSEERTW